MEPDVENEIKSTEYLLLLPGRSRECKLFNNVKTRKLGKLKVPVSSQSEDEPTQRLGEYHLFRKRKELQVCQY